LAFFSHSQAAVHFTRSLILDEFDLIGKNSVSLDSICLQNGCKVYVSAVKDDQFIGKLSFQGAEGANAESLESYAYDFDKKTQQKIPFVAENNSPLSIVNSNENFACGPIVIYAISNDANNLYVAGVYDVSRTFRDEQAIGKVVTIIGPRPFTVWASSPSEEMEASVYMTGFDIEKDDKCIQAYHSTRGLGIKYSVNGPITTLFFEEEVQMNVDFFEFFEKDLEMTSATFISSPGFIGCSNGEVYRTSLYPNDANFTFTSDIARSVHLEAYLNTEDPLELTVESVNTITSRSFTGTINSDSYHRMGEVSATKLSFFYTMSDSSSSFLVKMTDLGLTQSTVRPRRTTPPTTRHSTPSTSLSSTSPSIPPTTPTVAAPTTSGMKGASLSTFILLVLLHFV
ncbi:hypothetical protein PFISCL1PPCAC_19461, partial [Pristionchus fissidentatus]